MSIAALDARTLGEFPLPVIPDDGDKEDRGRLLVIGGSREVPGAAWLAGLAGLRVGAGKLQVATAGSVAVPLAIAIPEARVIGHAETDSGCLAESGVDGLVALAKEAAAVVVGCGMQHGPPLDALIAALLDCGLEVPVVLDAAVLGSLADQDGALRDCGRAVLLPHPGEMKRLIGWEPDRIAADPLGAAQEAAERYAAVTLIKGGQSYIVAPDGRAFRFEGGGVGLATSGSGDTLAGIVGGLAARGADPLTACLWGVFIHGEAGRRLSRAVGRVGFLAREIVDKVPEIVSEFDTGH